MSVEKNKDQKERLEDYEKKQKQEEPFTLEKLKESIEELDDTEFMMTIPIGGGSYGR